MTQATPFYPLQHWLAILDLPLHHQASQTPPLPLVGRKAKAFCPWLIPLRLLHSEGGLGSPTRGTMVGQADRGLWTFFIGLYQSELSSGSNIFHSGLKSSQVNWNSSRSWRYKNRSCHPFFWGAVLINCYWGIVAFQCCVRWLLYSKVSLPYVYTPLFGDFLPLGHRRALSRPPVVFIDWQSAQFCVDRHLGLSFGVDRHLGCWSYPCQAWEWTPGCLFPRTLKSILKRQRSIVSWKVPADVSKRQGNHTWLLYWDIKYLNSKFRA